MRFTAIFRVGGALSLVLLAGCSPEAAHDSPDERVDSSSSPSTTSTGAAPSTTPSASDLAEEWADRGVDDYRLEITVRNPNGMGGGGDDATYRFVVVDGRMAECEVTDIGANAHVADDFCDTTLPPLEFLFTWLTRFDPAHTSVSYDPHTRLPTRIFYDVPGSIDEEYEILVESSEIHEARR